jgi:transposase-like protein
MSFSCPKCLAPPSSVRKHGAFFRKSDSQLIQRYFCPSCRHTFSSATFCANFNQNKRRVNSLIRKLLSSNTSHRRIALIAGVNRKTVARKRSVLAQQAALSMQEYFAGEKYAFVQFDDLETIEHSKLKPVTVTLFVNEQRKILGFDVARIAAKGHLSKLALKKYGTRPNEAPMMRERLFAQMQSLIDPLAVIESDEHPSYPDLVRKYFPQAEHRTYKSSRSSVAGQGELKKVKFDPLFKINHTFAMLRANISRLIRRTWNTTKDIEALKEHLTIYADYHNRVLT